MFKRLPRVYSCLFLTGALTGVMTILQADTTPGGEAFAIASSAAPMCNCMIVNCFGPGVMCYGYRPPDLNECIVQECVLEME